MCRCIFLIVLSCALVLSTAVRAADSELFRIKTDDRNDWQLAVIDGEPGFFGYPGKTEENGPVRNLPVLQPRVALLRRDDTLQIFVDESIRKEYKAQAEKHLWYLTADYAAEVPVVRLTKEPTEFSHWKIAPASELPGDRSEDLHRVYIKNTNKGGKEGWLRMKKAGTHYPGATEFRSAILSLEDKQVFVIPGSHYGGR